MAWGQSLPAPIAINPSLPPHTQRQAETYSLEVRFNVIKLTPPPTPECPRSSHALKWAAPEIASYRAPFPA